MHQQIERVTLAGDQVFDAAQDQRAAVAILRRLDFIERQPAGSDDAFVELALGFPATQFAGEGEAQVGDILRGMLPVVNPTRCVGLKW